jgi:hypothetical protein
VTSGGRISRVAVRELPLTIAVIVAIVADATGAVVTVKSALVEPAGMATEAGTAAAGLSLLSETVTPPAGAAAPSVAVPVELAAPPVTVPGFTETLATWTR